MPDPISWEFAWPYYLGALAFGYLLGSIPFGLILTRLAGLGDIRNIGSGNIGTTNVLRTGNKALAAATLLGDALKGTAAVLIVSSFYGQEMALVAGFGAFLGHLFPIWLKFRGGKGVATYIGIMLGLFWPAGLIFVAIWIGMAVLFRYSSLSALSASLATPVILYLVFNRFQLAEMALLMTVLLWAKHHENIGRLLRGEESRIGAKSGSSPAPETNTGNGGA
ncbi:glycerol-3-phosphate acyltransferase PlsY [Labrenzia sp. EL_208]|uniref:glycerol-3-phosphate 1-O-acyltransferase PlsY n=1 Tax=Roseibium album TaxID=311410 RepID=UPI0018CBB85D|nr:glycerol-3-phosphate 1-O-acyltransferase PlsY [Roseibium album]MBG6155753.1 glycerol-3-phosphate acyltransferase PlsY [Labrenzia sp. EL_162]MBG6177264.1 glycerol-3-phosphate acyltransferase PlsY [Labrenzia sp. EL_132]MBG6194287.1 glycerol-3-phosphate acyltransferase PlsY [Labrenzia sp. EL_159]MBG6231885.1 glycerol-3-phosphate acyltransferase PlsY [Labrenzia sp. EL_208]